MIDGIIKADGTSRLMRAELPATYEEFRAQCHAGAQPLDVLFNAIGWSQMPTFLNKANLLKDATATLFGKDSGAVPNDLFAWLGQYAQHWWSVLHGQEGIGYEEKRVSFLHTDPSDDGGVDAALRICYTKSSQTLYYSDSITIDQSGGAVSLSNPQSFEFSCGDHESTMQSCAALANLGPCYITNCYGDPDAIYYMPAGATYTSSSNDATSTFMYSRTSSGYTAFWNNNSRTKNPAYLVESQIYNIPAGETTYVHSTDRNAYPDSGTVDGLTYQYLGIPFQNAVTAPKIEMGSYVGTGTDGESNPNSLTFDFVPKFVIIEGRATWCYGGVFWVMDTSTGASNHTCPASLNDKTLTWYSYEDDRQLNASGTKYNYVAIG